MGENPLILAKKQYIYIKNKNSKLSYLAIKKMQKVNEGQYYECKCIHIKILTNLKE